MRRSSGTEKNELGTSPSMLAILVAAMVMASASLSSLGVGASRTTMPGNAPIAAGQLYENETVAVTIAGTSPELPPAPAAPVGIYDNETVAVSLAGSSPDPQPAPAAPAGVYENETTGTHFETERH